MTVTLTKEQEALKALDGMEEIVRNEMVIRGTYATDDIVNSELLDSICGGRQYCAIGSLWVGYGFKYDAEEGLIGVGDDEYERNDFVDEHPGLRVALDALNARAQKYMDKHEIAGASGFNDPIEALFEAQTYDTETSTYSPVVSRKDLLKIIRKAKKTIEDKM